VGKAFARLLDRKRAIYPFPIVGIHTEIMEVRSISRA
jgi:hypothetical protein